jgi:hypothetical protein
MRQGKTSVTSDERIVGGHAKSARLPAARRDTSEELLAIRRPQATRDSPPTRVGEDITGSGGTTICCPD